MAEEIKPRIMIIEDEALVARELKSRLTQMGCEVVGIAYGIEGIELAKQTRPDLLLADIHLKDGADGIEVAETIKRYHDLPVVFLTAYSDQETVSRAKTVTPYSYIIKPVESRELQIAIDMALYKFNIERELRETRQLLETALACIGNALIFVDAAGRVTDMNEEACELLGKDAEDPRNGNWRELFELGVGSSVGETIATALNSDSVTKLPPFLLVTGEPGVPSLVDGIVGPLDSGGVLILRQLSEIHDSIETLPTAEELLADLGSERLGPSESSLCQLLIYTDSPVVRESNRIILEVSSLLDKVLRSTDLVSIYAGSLLSVSMPYTSVEEGKKIADAILQELNQRTLGDGQGEVSFSIGLAHSGPGDQQPIELFRRAGWALNVALESGGDRVVVWTPESERKVERNTQQALVSRQYHNLVLLWNVMSVVTKSRDLHDMAEKFCSHLLFSFELEKAALLSIEDGSVREVGGILRGGARQAFSIDDLALSSDDVERFERLLSGPDEHSSRGDTHLFAINGARLLLLQGTLGSEDVDFIATLTRYMATGLAGFDLADEVPPDARSDNGEMIVGSTSMEGVVESARMVAETDATVLISGESGTGKEMLARRIHRLSPRGDKSFVIVDCGAVVESLIESELFGHVRGAFTGANKNFSGRLKEADGGTVLLDEIGELPLDVQVKLLRFVQEREVIPVGTNAVDKVDTRVIAATNRNLKELVSQGKFREDLYYRLNVFSIETPPLRDRKEDILALANYYLARFRSQYNKDISGFSREAERALLDHDWPGNVRELVNLINRAVILCRDSLVNTIHLGLFPINNVEDSLADPVVPTRVRTGPDLKSRIRLLVDRCLQKSGGSLPPLGVWLEEDVLAGSIDQYGDALGQIARLLYMSEATLRRKVARIQEVYGTVRPERPDGWVSVDSMLDELVVLAEKENASVPDVVSAALLDELNRRDLSKRDAATLMGVSLPTYRRLTS